MDKIDSLIEEHATLRRLSEELETLLGKQTGVGWDDQTSGALPRLCAAQQRFRKMLKAHEEREERVIGEALQRRPGEREEFEAVIRRAHASLDGTAALLRTLSSVCDGKHVYAVRTMAEHLRKELEAHLAYEEKVLFPLLRRRHAHA